MSLAKNLKQYQEPGGATNFKALMAIPIGDRIPGLVQQYGNMRIHALLVKMLTDFTLAFNIGRSMSTEQIVQCAFDLMISAEEDQLSIEDLAMFFDKARKGEYGKCYDRLDQQVIFDWLEQHRQRRHEELISHKMEEHLSLKGIGPSFRSSDDAQAMKDLFHQANVEYFGDQYKQDEKSDNNP